MGKKWLAVIWGYEQEIVFAEIHQERPKEFTIVIKNQTANGDLVWYPCQHYECNTLGKAKEKVRKFFENYLRGLKGKPWKAWHWEER